MPPAQQGSASTRASSAPGARLDGAGPRHRHAAPPETIGSTAAGCAAEGRFDAEAVGQPSGVNGYVKARVFGEQPSPPEQSSVPEAVRADPPVSWDGAAALSAGSLAAFVPPPGTTRLLIAADRDAAGRCAAAGLEARMMAQGLAVTVLTPAHDDFNDDLAALGPRALAARLAPLLGPGKGP